MKRPGSPRSTVRRHGLDAAVVAVTFILYVIAWPTLHVTHDVSAGIAPAVAALAVLPLVLIRVNPAVGWALSITAAFLVSVGFDNQPGNELPWQVVHILVLIMLVFAVALRSPAGVVATAWGVTSLLFVVQMPGSDADVGWPVVFAMVIVFGLLVRWLVQSRAQLASQEEATELERAQRTVLEEKARIARDLHDVVAHHMSLVVVRAQTASYRVPSVSTEARTEFDAIAATARTALNEVRGILGLLRSDNEQAERLPQPGIAQLDDVIQAAERAGMSVSWTVTGDLEPISDAVGLTLYRVVQESLANAARHAAGAAVAVRLDCEPDSVRLTVTNGPGTTASTGTGVGHGILGMRERVAAVAGTLDAAARADGGFEVVARLPRWLTETNPSTETDKSTETNPSTETNT